LNNSANSASPRLELSLKFTQYNTKITESQIKKGINYKTSGVQLPKVGM